MQEQDRLLFFAGVNLMLAVAMTLPLARRHLVAAFRVAVASVAGVWTLLMATTFLYFQVTMPPAFASPPRGFFLSAVDRSDAALQWVARLSMAASLAWWTTAATLVAVLVLWLMSAYRSRRWDGAPS